MVRKRKVLTSAVLTLLCSVLIASVPLVVGCAGKSLEPFQPEIANKPDNFQFQITAAKNVTTTIEYSWQNSGTRATINQASAITNGSATVTLYDANQVQRYSSSLNVNGPWQSDTGAKGTWKVRVVLTNLSGTLNFRVQKLD